MHITILNFYAHTTSVPQNVGMIIKVKTEDNELELRDEEADNLIKVFDEIGVVYTKEINNISVWEYYDDEEQVRE